MAGRIVWLLMISMVGMVQGQQPQSNTDQFGNPLGGLNRNTSGTASGLNPGSSASRIDQMRLMKLELSDGLIQQFRERGQLIADISPRSSVNGIIFLHDQNKDQTQVSGLMQPTAKQGETIMFELDDADLLKIKSQGLKYTFDSFELGKYKEVQVDFRAPVAANRLVVNQAGGFGGSITRDPVAHTHTTALPMPSLDYGLGFMGPIPDYNNLQPIRRDSNAALERQSWGPTPNAGNQLANSFGNSTGPTVPVATNQHHHDHQFESQFGNSQFGNSNTRPQNNLSSSNSFGQSSSTTRNFNPTQNVTSFNQPNPRRNENIQPITSSPAMLAAERRRRAQIREKSELEARIKQRDEREEFDRLTQNNQRMRRVIEDMEYDLANGSRANRQRLLDYPDRQVNSGNLPLDHLAKGGIQPRLTPMSTTESNNRSPMPRENSGTGGVDTNQEKSDVRQVVKKEQKAEPKSNKHKDAMLLMLLGSIGLNVYLALMSRSHYVRYNELADELRETFTATM